MEQFCLKQAKTEDNPPTSPSPDRATSAAAARVTSQLAGDSSVSDARATLKELQERRTYLEANLDAILRARQETEVYAAIDSLTQGFDMTSREYRYNRASHVTSIVCDCCRSTAERLRIRKLVDQYIQRMNPQMEARSGFATS